MLTETRRSAAQRAFHEVVRLRWPIPLAVGLLALTLAVAGSGSSMVGARLGLAALAIAAFATALYTVGGFVARRLPPLSAEGLGLFRIAWALALLHVLPFLRGSVHESPFPRSDQRTENVVNIGPAHWLASHQGVTGAIAQIVVVALFFFAIGAFARLAYVVVALGFAALGVAAAMAQGSHDWDLPLVVILCLIGMPWGDGVSVDDTIRRLRQKPRPERKTVYSLAIWLPGLLLGSAWLAAAYAKLNHSGFAWISGGAVRYHFVSDASKAHSDLGLWIASHPTAAVIASAGGVLFEATFILVIFFRSYWIRLAFAAGAALFFAGLYEFQGIQWEAWWIVLVALLPWEPLAAAIRRLLPRATLLIDGGCRQCRRTARILNGLDWFDRLAFVDATDDAERGRHAPSVDREQALNRMAVVDGNGGVHSGFDAYRRLSLSVLILAPLGLVAFLPGLDRLGERVYDSVAAHRHRCGDECATGPLPGKQTHVLARAATLSVVACVLVAGIVVTQTVVSDKQVEREPFLTNFPMYSDTYASTAAYDEAHRKSRDLRFFLYRPPNRVDLLVSRQNEVFPMDEPGALPVVAIAQRHALVQVVSKQLKGGDISPKLRRQVAVLTAGVQTVSGDPVSGELVATENEYGFDWKHGHFFIRHQNEPVALLDLRTLNVDKVAWPPAERAALAVG
jgi:predicted DCC family thiol-disulfide oxidoreductase YuxK